MSAIGRVNIKGALITGKFFHEIAREGVAGMSSINKFGRTPALSNNDDFEVWDIAADYIWPTTSAQVVITSSSDFDEPADGFGTLAGAQTVILTGLVDDYTHNTETIAMSGTSSGSYRRVYRVYAGDVGVSGVNVGNIAVTHGVDVIAQISAGVGQTLMAIYTVASGTTGLLVSWSASVVADDAVNSKSSDFELYTREVGGKSKRIRDVMGMKDKHGVKNYNFPIKIPAMTDVWIQAIAKSNSTKVTAGFEVEHMDDEVNNRIG